MQQLIVIIRGTAPNRTDPKETSAAERLVRVRHLTVARAAELMEFVIERPDLREKVQSVRAFELCLKELDAAYEAERQAKLRAQAPPPKDVDEFHLLQQVGRGCGERVDWLRDEIAKLRRSGLRGAEYRAALKQLLEALQQSDAA